MPVCTLQRVNMNLCYSYVIFIQSHIGSCRIQPAYKRSRHVGESYNSGQGSGCSHRKPGLRKDERGDGRCLWWSSELPYRWDGRIMIWFLKLFNSSARDDVLYFVYLQSNQPFPGVSTKIFSKWTTWFPPRTIYLHRNHMWKHQQQVYDPLLGIKNLKLLITVVCRGSVFHFLILFPISKIRSCQTNHRLHHARVQEASGWWLYSNSLSKKDGARNDGVRTQPDPRIQLSYPTGEENSKRGEEKFIIHEFILNLYYFFS